MMNKNERFLPFIHKYLAIIIISLFFVITLDKILKCFDFFSHVSVQVQIKLGLFAGAWLTSFIILLMFIKKADQNTRITTSSKKISGLGILLKFAELSERAIPAYIFVITFASSIYLMFTDELIQLGFALPAFPGSELSQLGKGATSLLSCLLVFLLLRIVLNAAISILKKLQASIEV